MVDIKLSEEKKTVFARFSGKVDKADYERFIPVLNTKIQEYGKIRLYYEMDEVEGYTVEAAWKT